VPNLASVPHLPSLKFHGGCWDLNQDSSSQCCGDADPNPAFHFDPDPDPTFHSDAVPDGKRTFQFDPAPDPDPTPSLFSRFGPSSAPR
jgi:hypothetical protein